jgi:flagellar protein FlgJ
MATTTAPVTSSVDLRGLERLRHSAAKDDPAAVAEAAVQFEALFIGLMLETARSASLGDGLFDGPQTQQYLELMDQQVALEVARRGGLGFGKLLMQQLADRGAVTPSASGPLPITPADIVPTQPQLPPAPPMAHFPQGLPATLGAVGGAAPPSDASTQDADDTSTATDFVARFLPSARKAAEALGIEPRLLLAQAALETGWGKSLDADAARSNNLFGIKASAAWQGPSVSRWTLEHADGVALRKQERFRAYPDTGASFADYVDLIGSSPRYAAALERGADPQAYAHEVASAGYATDPAYASKWLAIYHGERLTGALQAVDTAATTE